MYLSWCHSCGAPSCCQMSSPGQPLRIRSGPGHPRQTLPDRGTNYMLQKDQQLQGIGKPKEPTCRDATALDRRIYRALLPTAQCCCQSRMPKWGSFSYCFLLPDLNSKCLSQTQVLPIDAQQEIAKMQNRSPCNTCHLFWSWIKAHPEMGSTMSDAGSCLIQYLATWVSVVHSHSNFPTLRNSTMK